MGRLQNGVLLCGTTLLIVITFATAGPTTLAPPLCSSFCEDSARVGYVNGATYIYAYTGETTSWVRGTQEEGDAGKLHLQANVHMHVMSPCDYVLQLSDVKLTASGVSVSEWDSNGALNTPLAFSMRDGAVEELCPGPDETRWALNIKRGVLSSLQIGKGINASYERDISGDCFTEFYPTWLENDGVAVRRVKDLSQCSDRSDLYLSTPTQSYETGSARSKPILGGYQTCTYIFDSNKILKSTDCEEEHKLQPFSSQDGGAVTVVKQTLKLTGVLENQSAPKAIMSFEKRSSLLYDRASSGQNDQNVDFVSSALAALDSLEKTTETGTNKGTPGLFRTLAGTLRQMNRTDLKLVLGKTTGNSRTFLLDAMPLVTSADGVSVMLDLYHSGSITSKQLESYLTDIALTNEPSLDIIEALNPLLQSIPSQKAVLTISSLVHGFCRNNQECTAPIIKATVDNIDQLLGEDCQPGKGRSQEEIILGLKGLGNAGLTNNKDSLKTCYEDSSLNVEIRVQALAAYRRMSCDIFDSESLFSVLENIDESVEVRLATYLALMRCPSFSSISAVKRVLFKEQVNQVGSFIWTHLRNLQETSSQTKQNVKELLTSDFLRKKFDTDMRKYSRNYEMSTFFDSVNAGGNIESNIIFTPESFIPKSAMLNLTVDLFGESVNLFEIGGRAEGLEGVIDNVFGPRGYFPDKTISKMLHDTQNTKNSVKEFEEEYDAKHQQITTPKCSVYAKIFGNELKYISCDEFRNQFRLEDIFSRYDVFQMLKNDQDINWTKSFVFVDTSYTVPTMLGFPLELALNGATTIGLKLNGKVQISDKSNSYRLEAEGHLVPSAAVEILGTMTVDAYVAKSGLKMSSTLNSNTYADGKVVIEGGKLIDFTWNVPKKRIDVFNVQSQLFVIHNDREVSIKGYSNREEAERCSSENLGVVTGVQLCGEISYPNASLESSAPSFPLTGPFRCNLQLRKTDNFDSYEFKYRREIGIEDGRPVYGMSLYLDTPKSGINRRINIGYNISTGKGIFDGRIQTPFVNLNANGKLTNDHNKKGIEWSTLVNSKPTLYLLANVDISNNTISVKYEPRLKVSYVGETILDASGGFVHSEKNKYNGYLNVEGLTKEPVKIDGEIHINNKRIDWNGVINSSSLQSKIHGNIKHGFNYYAAKSFVSYSNGKAPSESFELSTKYQNVRSGTSRKKGVSFVMHTSQYPHYDVVLVWDLQQSPNYFDHAATVGFGDVVWKTNQLYSFKKIRPYHDAALLCTLTCDSRNINYGIDLKYASSGAGIYSHALAQMNEKQKLFAKINYVNKISTVQAHNLDLELYYPEETFTFSGDVKETDLDLHEIFAIGQRKSVTEDGEFIYSMKTNGSYRSLSENIRQRHYVTLSVDLSHPDDVNFAKWDIETGFEASEDLYSGYVNTTISGDVYNAEIKYENENIFTVNTYKVTSLVNLKGKLYDGKIQVEVGRYIKTLEIDIGLEKRLYLTSRTLAKFNPLFELDFYWDKDNDADKKFHLQVLRSSEEKNSVDLKITYPGREIEGSCTITQEKIMGMLKWDPESQISIALIGNSDNSDGLKGMWTLSVETPFENFENQAANMTYKLSSTGIDVKMFARWQTDSLTFSLLEDHSNLPALNVSFDFNSSFKILPNLELAVVHYLGEYENYITQHINGTFNLSHNDKRYRGVLYSNSYGYQTTAGCVLVGPEKETIFTGHYIGAKSKSLLQGLPETKSIYSLMFSWYEEELSAHYTEMNSKVSVTLKTPFDGIEYTNVEYKYDVQPTEGTILAGVNIFKKEIGLDVGFSMKDNLINGTLIMKTHLMDDVAISLKHSTIEYHYDEEFLLRIPQPYGPINFKVKSDSGSYLSVDLEIPKHVFHTSIAVTETKQDSKTKFDYKWNMATAHVTLLETITVLPSSYGFETRWKFDIDGTVVSSPISAECTLTQDQSYIMEVKIVQNKLGYYINNTLEVSKSFRIINNNLYFKTYTHDGSLILANIYDDDSLELDHSTYFTLNNWESAIYLSSKMHERFRVLSDLRLEIKRPTRKNDELNSIVIKYEMPISNNVFSPRLSYVDQKSNDFMNITTDIKFSYPQGILGSVIKSSFIPTAQIELSYDLKPRTQNFELMTAWNGLTVKMHADFLLESNKASSVLKVTRSDFDKNIFLATFEINKENKKLRGVVKIMDIGQFEIDSFLRRSHKFFDLSVNVVTPFEGFERLNGAVSSSCNEIQEQIKFMIEKNEQKTVGSVIFNFDERSSELRASMEDHVFSIIKDTFIYYKFENIKSTYIWDNNFNYGHNRFESNAIFTSEKNNLLLEITVNTPFDFLRESLLHFDWKSSVGEKSFLFNLNKDGKDYRVQGLNNLGKTSGSAECKAVFDEKLIISATLIHDMLGVDHDVIVLNVEDGYSQKIKVEVVRFISNNELTNSVQHSIQISTPFESYKVLKGKLYLRNINNTYTTGVQVTKNKDTYELQTAVQIISVLVVDTSIKVITPIQGYETLEAGLSYDLSMNEKILNCFVEYSDNNLHEVEISANVEGIAEADLKIILKSNILENGTLIAEFDYNFVAADKFVNFFVNSGVNNVILNCNLALKQDGLVINLKTPIASLENIEIFGIMFKNSESQHTGVLSMNLNSEVHELSVSYYNESMQRLTLEFSSSVRGYDQFLVELKFKAGLVSIGMFFDKTDPLILMYNQHGLTGDGPFISIHKLEQTYLSLNMKPQQFSLLVNTGHAKYTGQLDYVIQTTNGNNINLGLKFARNDDVLIELSAEMSDDIKDDNLTFYYLSLSSNGNVLSDSWKNLNMKLNICPLFLLKSGLLHIKRKENIILNLETDIFDSKRNGFTATLNLETPACYMEKAVLSLEFYPQDVIVKTRLQTTIEGKIYEHEKHFIIDCDNNEISIGIKAPTTGDKFVGFKWKHDVDKIIFSLNLPFVKLEDISFAFSRHVNENGTDIEVIASKGMHVINGKISYIETENSGVFTATLITPIEKLKYTTLSIIFKRNKRLEINFMNDQIEYSNLIAAIQQVDDTKNYMFLINVPKFLESVKFNLQFNDWLSQINAKFESNIRSSEIKMDAMLNFTPREGKMIIDTKFLDKSATLRVVYDVSKPEDELLTIVIFSNGAVFSLSAAINNYYRSGNIQISNDIFTDKADKYDLHWKYVPDYDKDSKSIIINSNLNNNPKMISLTTQSRGRKNTLVYTKRDETYTVQSEYTDKGSRKNLMLDFWGADKEIQVSLDFDFTATHYLFEGHIKSPYKNLEKIVFKNEITFSSVTTITSFLKWPEDNKILLTGSLKAKPGKVATEFHFETPMTETLNMALNYDFAVALSTIEASFDLGKDSRIEFSGKKDTSSLDFELVSPFIGFTTLHLNINHDKKSNQLRVYFMKENLITEFTGSVQRDGHRVTVDLQLQSPDGSDYPDVHVVAHVDSDKLTGVAKANWNEDNNINLNIKVHPENTYLKLDTPFENARNIELSGKYASHDDYFTLTSDGFWDDVTIHFDGLLKATPSDMKLITKCDLNKKYVVSLHATNVLTDDSLDTKFEVTSSFKQLDRLKLHIAVVKDIAHLSLKTLTSSIAIVTPFESVPEVTSTAVFKSDADRNLLSAEINAIGLGETISINSSYSYPNDLEGIFNVNADIFVSFAMEQPLHMETRFDLLSPNLGTRQVKWMAQIVYLENYTIDSVYRFSTENLNISLKFKTPVFEKNMMLSASLHENSEFKFADVALRLNDNNVLFNHKRNNTAHVAKFVAHLPYFDLESADISASFANVHDRTRFSSAYELPNSKGNLIVTLDHTLGVYRLENNIPVNNALGFSVKDIIVKYHDQEISFECITTHVNMKGALNFNETDIVISGLIPKTVYLHFKRNMEYVHLVLDKDLDIEGGFAIRNGYLTILNKDAKHAIVYKTDHEHLDCDVESPYITSRHLTVNLYKRITKGEINISAKLIEGESRHVFTLTSSSELFKMSLSVKLAGSSMNLLQVSTERNIEIGSIAVSVKAPGLETVLDIGSSPKFRANFFLNSPSQTNVTASVITSNNIFETNIAAFTSNKAYTLKRTLYISNIINLNDWTTKTIIETPVLESVQLVQIDSGLTLTKIFAFYFNVNVESDIHGRNSLKTNFNFTPSLFTSLLQIKLPSYKQDVMVDLNIPFVISNQFQPTISLKLNSNEYKIFISYLVEKTRFSVGAGGIFETSELSSVIDLNVGKLPYLKIVARSPYNGFEKYEFNINIDNESLKRRLGCNVKWNNQEIDLAYNLEVRTRVFHTSLHLKTPFKNYEKYMVEIDFTNAEVSYVNFKLFYPSLVNTMGVTMKYKVHDFTDIDFLFIMNTPFINGLENVGFVLKSLLDVEQHKYLGIISGKLNSDGIELVVNGAIDEGGFSTNVTGKYNAHGTTISILGLNTDLKKMAKLSFKSDVSIMNINNTELYLLYSKNVKDGFQLRTVLNSVSYIDASFRMDEDEKTLLIIENPWRPVSFTYQSEPGKGSGSYLYAVVCWDTTHRRASSLGGSFTLRHRAITTSLILPNMNATFIVGCQNNGRYINAVAMDRVYYARASVNDKDLFGFNMAAQCTESIGVSSLKKYSVVLYTPARRWQIGSSLNSSAHWGLPDPFIEMVSYIQWNEADTEKISTTIRFRKAMLETKILWPGLDKPIIVRLRRDPTKDVSKVPYSLQMEVDYSDNPKDFIQFSCYKTNSPTTFEVGFELVQLSSKTNYNFLALIKSEENNSNTKLTLKHMDHKHVMRLFEVYGEIDVSSPSLTGYIVTDRNRLFGLVSTWKKHGSSGVTLKYAMNFKDLLVVKAGVNDQDQTIDFKLNYGQGRKYAFDAGMPTNREVVLRLKHQLLDSETTDLLFHTKLNTTRLLWTKMQWRSGIFNELRANILSEYDELGQVLIEIEESFFDIFDNNFVDKILKDVKRIYKNVTSGTERQWTKISQDFRNFKNLAHEHYMRNDFYSRDILDYLTSVKNYIEDKLFPIFEPMFKLLTQLKNSVADVANFMFDQISDFASKVSQNIAELLETSGDQIAKGYTEVNELRQSLKIFIKQRIERLRNDLKTIESNAVVQIERLHQYLDGLKTRVRTYLQPYVDAILLKVAETIDALANKANDIIDQLMEYIFSVRELRETIKSYLKFVQWINDEVLDVVIDKFVNAVIIVAETVSSDIDRVLEIYKPYFHAAYDVLAGQCDSFNNLTEIITLKQDINQITEKFIWIWDYNDLTTKLINYVEQFFDDLDTIIQNIDRYIDDEALLQGSPDPIYDIGSLDKQDFVFKPQQGLIEISHSLPVEWTGFDTSPKWDQLKTYREMLKVRDELEEFSTAATIRWVKKMYTTITSKPAPPPAYGMLISSKHIRTFDGVIYTFLGRRSYLLTSDLADKSFSVIANFKREPTDKPVVTSLSITSAQHPDTIEIFQDFKVTLDGEEIDLPASVESTFITREHDSIVIRISHKIKIEWNLKQEIVMVTLSDWKRGKTGGLLGNSDDEAYNEMSLPNGTITRSVEDFAKGWKIGRTTEDIRTDPKLLSTSNRFVFQWVLLNQCKLYFNNTDSPLKSCFGVVDAMPFYEMCLKTNDFAYNVESSCHSTVAYEKLCRLQGVDVSVPEICVHCPEHSAVQRPFNAQPSNPAADVVFLVEASECITLTNLTRLPVALDESLTENGIGVTDGDKKSLKNRYSVVSFGGRVLPLSHSKTARHSVWNDAETSAVALRNDRENDRTDAQEDADKSLLPALKYASRLRFRPGVQILFVLVTCDVYQDDGTDDEIIDFVKVNGIKLHLLQPDTIQLLSPGAKPTKVFGVDQKNAFTAKTDDNTVATSLRSNLGMSRARRTHTLEANQYYRGMGPSRLKARRTHTLEANQNYTVSVPKDESTRAAMESGGSLFNLDHLMSVNDGDLTINQDFVRVWAQRVASNARPKQQTCQCFVTGEGDALVMCNDEQTLIDLQNWDASPDEYDSPIRSSVEYSDEVFV